ncbi:isochorismatase [Ligilactobacillus salitolerans]|uniref:Isochorismatase n=1 Tax=Ligilactobacillus salitolerans TaxID=1808352 RepID=A0A401IV01_9LACO|nr:isochorismatase family cysteine hydrolase [Ligilactobacillus salitolerans]GBG95380.1 isochorismatase [Ligilactobacillus salitolerans]
MSEKKALLVIDYTNDFVAENGALNCGEPGRAIQPALLQHVHDFAANNDYVILPTDLHHLNDPYHPETKLFPPHNIEGTPGQELYDQLGVWYQEHQHEQNVWKYNKNRYSGFQNTDLDNFLRSRDIKDLYLTGVCTDICVLHTAIAAYNLNYRIHIYSDSVASFDQVGHEWALRHFKNSLGAEVL